MAACVIPGSTSGTTGQKWDVVVTMVDATSEHHSMFFCAEEGIQNSYCGTRETIAAHGLFCSFSATAGVTLGIHCSWGKVDKVNLNQFARALQHLGITMIAAYSPETRGNPGA